MITRRYVRLVEVIVGRKCVEGLRYVAIVFLALGIVLCILGAECLVMEKAVLASDRPLAEAAGPPARCFMATPMPRPTKSSHPIGHRGRSCLAVPW